MAGPSQKTLAFTLKKIPYRERDWIVILFSETLGKVHAMARNGKQSRRFGGSFDLFIASDFEVDLQRLKLSDYGEDSLIQAQSASVRYDFSDLGKSFEKMTAASALNELLIRALPNQKATPDLFKLYFNTLSALQDFSSDRCIPILNAFILKLAQWLGVQPALTRCQTCQKTLNEVEGDLVFPHFESGGWSCLGCTKIEERRSERASARKLMSKTLILDAYHSLLNPIKKIEWAASWDEHLLLLTFLEQHLVFFVPGLDRSELKSIKILKSLPPPPEMKTDPED